MLRSYWKSYSCKTANGVPFGSLIWEQSYVAKSVRLTGFTFWGNFPNCTRKHQLERKPYYFSADLTALFSHSFIN